MVKLSWYVEHTACGFKAEALVPQRPSKRLQIQEASRAKRLMAIAAYEADECRLRILGTYLNSWTKGVGQPLSGCGISIAGDHEAPPPSASRSRDSIFDSQA